MSRERKRWCKSEERWLCENYNEHGALYCAEKLQRTRIAVLQKASKLGMLYQHGLRKPTPSTRTKALAELISGQFNCTATDVFSRSKLPHVVAARDMVANELRRNRFTFHQIGKQLGRDHSAIIDCIRRHAERSAT